MTVDYILLSSLYDSLQACDKSFFSFLNTEELETCKKIAKCCSTEKVNPIQTDDAHLQAIQTQITNYKAKIIQPTKSKISAKNLDIIYKRFHPKKIQIKKEELVSRDTGSLSNGSLPLEILTKILSESASFDTFLVSKQWANLMLFPKEGTENFNEDNSDTIWRGIANRLGCSFLKAERGKWVETVKTNCIDYIAEIKKLPEAGAIKDMLSDKGISIERIRQLKEWRKARETIVVWKEIAITIRHPKKIEYGKTFTRMIQKAKEFDKWCDKTDFSGMILLCLQQKVFPLASLPSLDSLSALKDLDLSNNQLTSLPSLDKLPRLLRLNVVNNRLTSLPSLDKLTAMQRLYLDGNQFTSLPVLDKLLSLQRLVLNDNQLTSLPSLDKLTALQRLCLGNNNRLSILPSLHNLTALECLYLNKNLLASLPSHEIDQLKRQGCHIILDIIEEI